jgi:hypothetical protein
MGELSGRIVTSAWYSGLGAREAVILIADSAPMDRNVKVGAIVLTLYFLDPELALSDVMAIDEDPWSFVQPAR